MFYVLPCALALVFFSSFSIAITSLGQERANLSAFRTFDRFVLVWFCRFSLPLGVWEGLQFVIVALPGLTFFWLSETEQAGDLKVVKQSQLRLLATFTFQMKVSYK